MTGSIGWLDMSVDDATSLKDFYAAVVGFDVEPASMGEYDDYTLLTPSSSSPVAGICHARGANAGMPRGWLPYFIVADLDSSIADCQRLGGELLVEPKTYGDGRFCVIRDPSGTAAALYQA